MLQFMGSQRVGHDSCPVVCTESARLLRPWDSPGKNTRMDSHSLLQGIFPTQESNLGLPHCRQILYCLSQQGSPYLRQLYSILCNILYEKRL